MCLWSSTKATSHRSVLQQDICSPKLGAIVSRAKLPMAMLREIRAAVAVCAAEIVVATVCLQRPSTQPLNAWQPTRSVTLKQGTATTVTANCAINQSVNPIAETVRAICKVVGKVPTKAAPLVVAKIATGTSAAAMDRARTMGKAIQEVPILVRVISDRAMGIETPSATPNETRRARSIKAAHVAQMRTTTRSNFSLRRAPHTRADCRAPVVEIVGDQQGVLAVVVQEDNQTPCKHRWATLGPTVSAGPMHPEVAAAEVVVAKATADALVVVVAAPGVAAMAAAVDEAEAAAEEVHSMRSSFWLVSCG